MLQELIKRHEKGFTLIELMIVIAIIGILAAIAIPNFINYRKRSYNAGANADIKNLYTAAQAYFTDSPSDEIDDGAVDSSHHLYTYGFRITSDVTTTVITSAQTQSSFSATTFHSAGDRTFTIYSDGTISNTS
jgi:prepilin-type N-terminal cleavage/methylation domain-containing protein